MVTAKQSSRIKSKRVLGRLQNPFGFRPREIELRSDDLLVVSGRGKSGSIKWMTGAPSIRKGWLASTVSMNFQDHTLTLGAVKHREAKAFVEDVRQAWIAHVTEQVEIERSAIDRVLGALRELAEPTRYPSSCLISPDLKIAQRLDADLFSKLRDEALTDRIRSDASEIQRFASKASMLREQAIEAFEDRQLAEWSKFFDSFESNPLTPEQRIGIIADEDATLVLAGAGSGKTSVITAKAGYLIKSKTRAPHEILLLAFAKDAAKEMSERIEQRCGEPLEARTFHSLAYDIIGVVEGSKPALANHATDDKAYLALIKDILIALVRTATEVSRAIIGWFSYARLDAKSEWDFKKKHDYYKHLEKLDLRTLQGEQVKSLEELMIANWLYENGIEYEYEPNYEHKVSEGGYRDYCPDFRLVRSGVYIEHFGVRRQKKRDGTTELTTAPFVDRAEYLEGMTWKRGIHEEHETTLIETYSYERQEGRLLEALSEKVAPFEEFAPRSPETLFDQVAELGQVDAFVQLVGTFLRHYKGGGYQFSDCETKAAKLKLGRRSKAFLTIFEPVYREYQSRLDGEGRIDFEDMILRACEYTESGRYRSPFKHILVDEFQDISESRGRLVKALKAQHPDGRVFAVGDDWQSIFRFAGSDINLMRRFGEEFGGTFDGKSGIHRTVDLGRTFRSVDQIAEAAMRFVLQNPAQLQKTVVPAGVAQSPALRVVPTYKHDADTKLKEALQAVPGPDDANEKPTVLLLGRYRHLRPDNLPKILREFPNLAISFKTIHASKGLEADHVIVLGLFRGRTGFPSEIVDDPLLGLVSPEAEPFENAEERRVMYVALTRARHTVTLMSSASKQSAFVTEMLDDPNYGIIGAEGQSDQIHICGECGGHLLAFPTKDGGMWYRCEHANLCGFSISACEACGVGLPEQEGGAGTMKCSTCGTVYPACPECDNGWLLERKSRYGRFLGCVSFPRCKGKAKFSLLE
jgi:DNA helicase-4